MKDQVYTIDILIQKILDGEKQYDLSKIISSYEFAHKSHEGQFRSSGEPYIVHPLAVAFIMLELGMDTDTICASMLHDVVEDTDATLEDIKKQFGQDVAMLVDGVTKLGNVPLYTKEEQQAENVRKILLAMSQDIRVIIIKLGDRLHNMRTLQHRPPHKQKITALETMNIYAPIAQRLGIRAVKDEIEDLSFHYLDPYAYAEIEHMMEIRKESREEFISAIKNRIMERFEEDNFIPLPQVDGRVKTIYGIYKKIYVNGKNIDEVYDKYAVRIIVNTVTECYNSLGIIHDMYRPIPNRFKDYISTPKPNMYQSLHTTVIGRAGVPFEVQIRTWDMHYTAEYGIAAHWKYKAGINGKDKLDSRLAWIRHVIETQQESDDVEEIVRTIKSDIAPEEVFAFTPKGDLITLPVDSIVIDFAYAIHTEIGHKMIGAKVNGKMMSLDYVINAGDIISIITTKDPYHGPNRVWLNMVKTNEAKSKIRAWYKKERREENIIQGKTELEKEFKRNQINIPAEDMESFLSDNFKKHNCADLQDFYASIGYGGILLSKILQRIKEKYTQTYVEKEKTTTISASKAQSTNGIIVEGIDNCLIKFSQCCNPLPGDDIVGFVTRGHGVSIHKCDCINYTSSLQSDENKERWVDACWAVHATSYYKTTLDIITIDRHGIFVEVCATLTEARVPIHSVSGKELKNGNANIIATISVGGLDQLSSLVNKLKKIKGVLTVDRTGK